MNNNLPVDHSANVLIGQRLPAIALPCTTDMDIDLTNLSGWCVIFICPEPEIPTRLHLRGFLKFLAPEAVPLRHAGSETEAINWRIQAS